METNKLEPAMDKANLAEEEIGTGETQPNLNSTADPIPFEVPINSMVFIGYGLEETLFVARELWKKMNVPEVTKRYYVELDTAAGGGLRLTFGVGGADYGNIILRPLVPQVKIEADTVLHQLERTTGMDFTLVDARSAIAWTEDFTQRLCRLEEFWDNEEIYLAARERHQRLYGHSPQW